MSVSGTANDRGLVNDKSIVSLSGSNQVLLISNPDRRYLLIQNTGGAVVGINLAGGQAVIGGTGTITLLPSGSYEPDAGFIPTNPINVIGTEGQPVICFEA